MTTKSNTIRMPSTLLEGLVERAGVSWLQTAVAVGLVLILFFIFDLRPLQSIGHWSLGIALFWIGGSVLSLLFAPQLAPNVEAIVLYGVLILTPVLVFFLNMLSTRQTISSTSTSAGRGSQIPARPCTMPGRGCRMPSTMIWMGQKQPGSRGSWPSPRTRIGMRSHRWRKP